MNVNTVVLLVVATALGAVVCQEATPFIVNGRDAEPGEVPWIVSLSSDATDGLHFCAGSIMEPGLILTAARCVYGIDPIVQHLKVRAGSLLLNTGGVQYSVSKIDIHPKYNANTHDFDAALLYLSKDIDFSAGDVRISSVFGPGDTAELPHNTILRSAGWGFTTATGHVLSTKLQVVDIPIIERSQCDQYYGGNGAITEHMICAAGFGAGACQGDSGGPLTGWDVQYGVVSQTPMPCNSKPVVFTEVVDLNPWIGHWDD